MKAFPSLRIFALLCCGVASLCAADWPRAFEAFEALVLKEPAEGCAWKHLYYYALNADRVDELAQRWEDRTAGGDGTKYHLMLGWLDAARKKPDAAREHFRKAAAMTPASSLPWFALGRFELAERQDAAAASALKKATEFELAADDSRDALLEFAEHLSRTGDGAKALEILERGWKGTADDTSRSACLARWANVALSVGKLGALIARFEPASRDGDAEAASDLASIYLAANDPSMAGSVLTNARKLHPEDQRLRRRAIAVAREVMNLGELARLLREEASATQTPQAWRELFATLVQYEANDAAREILDQHPAELTGAEGRWRDVLRLLRRLDLTPDRAMLERLKNEGGWEATLAWYQFLSEKDEEENAAEVLWDLFRPGLEQRPLSALAIEEGNRRLGLRYLAAIEGANWSYRRSMASSGSTASSFPQSGRPASSWPPGTSTLQDARDWALLQLAKSVSGTDRAAAFPAKLAEVIKSFPVSERIFAWSIVENVEHLLGEIDGYVAGGAGDAKLNGFCGVQLQAILRLARLDPALTHKAKELLERCPLQVYRPEEAPAGRAMSEMRVAISNNDFTLGAEKLDQGIEKFPGERDAFVMQFLLAASQGGARFQSGASPRAGNALPDDAIVAMVRAGSLATRLAHRLNHPPSDGALWMHEPPQNSNGVPYPRGFGIPRQNARAIPVFPPERLVQRDLVSVLWSTCAETPNVKGWPALKKKLDSVPERRNRRIPVLRARRYRVSFLVAR